MNTLEGAVPSPDAVAGFHVAVEGGQTKAGDFAGRQKHAFGQAELHLAGLQVGDDDDLFADDVGRFISLLDSREDLAQAALAKIDQQEAVCRLQAPFRHDGR